MQEVAGSSPAATTITIIPIFPRFLRPRIFDSYLNGMVLPAKRVARYLQIENKIQAVVKYDFPGGAPLV